MLKAFRFTAKKQLPISYSRMYHSSGRSFLPAATTFAADTNIFDKVTNIRLPYRLYHVSVPVLGPEKSKLFNREREVDFLLNLLRNKTPQLSLITGPTNSGKSMLMRHVMEVLSQDSREPTILPLNMRELPFTNVETFIMAFKRKLCKWYQRILTRFSIQSDYFRAEWEKSPPDLADLLEAMAKELPEWTWLHGFNIPVPILYIDEANLLRDLVINDPGGQKVLKSIFMWLVSMTKEQEKFHVILCSSDSFMHNWLANFVGNDRFNTYSIGHLGQVEARQFWDERIVTSAYKSNLQFEDVYEIAGGNMFLMKRLYLDYVFGGIYPRDTFFLQQAKSHLVKALSPHNPYIMDPLKAKPIWEEEQVVTIMRKLTSTEDGYLYYAEMRKEVGQVGLDSMIEYNIIHLRPYFALSCSDINPLPDRPEAIITAESQVGLLAMKQVLTDIDNNSL